jgi:hypothetical protein
MANNLAGSETGMVPRWLIAGVICLLATAIFLFVDSSSAQQKGDKRSQPPIPTSQADVERGKYIVEDVAMCPQCHSPRDASGAVDSRHLLEGAPELFQPPYPDPNWPLNAPRIGGNPPASDQDMIRLLTTGVWTDGKPLRLPMMPFRMSEADAKAVLAYLKSVKQEH